MIIPEDYAQVNLRFTGDAIPTGAEITFGVAITGELVTPGEIAAAVGNLWDTSGVMGNLTEGVALTEVLVKNGPNATGPSAVYPLTVEGEVESPTVPANTSALVTKLTPAGGRAGRGRFYLPGVQENGVAENGQMDPTLTANIQAALTQFLTDLDTNDIAMVVLHGAGSPITTPTFVNALVVNQLMATQRRRLRR